MMISTGTAPLITPVQVSKALTASSPKVPTASPSQLANGIAVSPPAETPFTNTLKTVASIRSALEARFVDAERSIATTGAAAQAQYEAAKQVIGTLQDMKEQQFAQDWHYTVLGNFRAHDRVIGAAMVELFKPTTP